LKIWIVGQIGIEHEGRREWAFCGAFSSKAAALAACLTPMHFVGPAQIDERIDEPREWPGVEYPLAEVAS
jgi:hypothetical protein